MLAAGRNTEFSYFGKGRSTAFSFHLYVVINNLWYAYGVHKNTMNWAYPHRVPCAGSGIEMAFGSIEKITQADGNVRFTLLSLAGISLRLDNFLKRRNLRKTLIIGFE